MKNKMNFFNKKAVAVWAGVAMVAIVSVVIVATTRPGGKDLAAVFLAQSTTPTPAPAVTVTPTPTVTPSTPSPSSSPLLYCWRAFCSSANAPSWLKIPPNRWVGKEGKLGNKACSSISLDDAKTKAAAGLECKAVYRCTTKQCVTVYCRPGEEQAERGRYSAYVSYPRLITYCENGWSASIKSYPEYLESDLSTEDACMEVKALAKVRADNEADNQCGPPISTPHPTVKPTPTITPVIPTPTPTPIPPTPPPPKTSSWFQWVYDFFRK